MGDFKRSPSKVWWASESLEWREVSSESPGSQDSGFSDSETCPVVSQNLLKKASPTSENSQNLSIKRTPDKCQKSPFNPDSSPRNKSKYTKNASNSSVSRNLFTSRHSDQYSKDITKNTTPSQSVISDTSSSYSGSYECALDEESERFHQSLPITFTHNCNERCNRSAPAQLDSSFIDDHNQTLSSDCESELECLFNGPLDSPKHTSTPKSGSMRNKKRWQGAKLPLHLFLKYQQQRVPPLKFDDVVDDEAVKKWLTQTRYSHDSECMITLQCKSIADELSQKVAILASQITSNIRNIITHSHCIEMEYKKLNSEETHVGPLVQSLAGNIVDFYKKFTIKDLNDSKLSRDYDNIRKSSPEITLKLIAQFFNIWQLRYQDILVDEAAGVIDRLENPQTEIDVKATVTAVTSLALRYDNLIDIFTKLEVIPVLVVLCEKCEGSSLRSLLLRALSTICCSTGAVRQFEKFAGLQILADILEDDSRPEPERAEAVALLAQLTAPWIEDNHCINGLEVFSKKLLIALTKFAGTTRCCQNLLLCLAALTNLSSMTPKCLKYLFDLQSMTILLDAVNRRGPRASIYILEQITSLIANMTALIVARKQLVDLEVPAVLLKFLKINSTTGEDVEKRIQQKAIIALSRLCSEESAIWQIVRLGGVEKLVKMCHDKNDRFDSDAVLIAALATLRKITDVCGTQVISPEDAQELVEPKLLDSFLAYSTQSESYV